MLNTPDKQIEDRPFSRGSIWRKWDLHLHTPSSYDYEDKEFRVLRSDCPDDIQPIIHQTSSAYVRMSGDGKKIYQISPWSGMYVGKFSNFLAAKDEIPAPKTYIGSDWEYRYFTSLIVITEGEFKGAKLPYMLHYYFDETEENGKSIVQYDHPKSKYTAQLSEFCDVFGVWEKGPMPYKDNILPMLQKRLLAEDIKVKMIIKNGNINTFFASNEPDTETVDEDSIPF